MKIFVKELAEMASKDRDHQTAWDYFEGGVPEYFATPQLRAAVRGGVSKIGMNHSRTIVTSITNRLEINNIVGVSDKSNKLITKVLKTNGKGQYFNDLFTKVSVYGEAFAMAWVDDKQDWRLSVDTPRNAYVKYSKENPWEKEVAFRVWQDGDFVRLNAFYPDRIEKYRASGEGIDFAKDWTLLDTVDNPFGEIPVFHLRNDFEHGRPEHFDAYSCQDAINKLIITHLDTVDYQGAPQRYALANASSTGGEIDDFDDNETDRANQDALKAGPGDLWYLKGVSQVGAFQAADPAVFWNPVKDYVRTMASLTETPIHYFEPGIGTYSGPGQRAAEAPLLKKAERRREVYTLAIEQLFAFILSAENTKSEITIKWESADSIDVLEEWDLLAKKRNVGLPLKQVLVEAGYAETEINTILEWSVEEQALELETYKRSTPSVRVQEQNDETNVDGINGLETDK